MRRTILGLLALALPVLGTPMGVKAEELKDTVSQSATSTVVNNTLTPTPVRRLSTELADLRAMREAAEARNAGNVVAQVSQPVQVSVQQVPPGPPPVMPTITSSPVLATPPQQEKVPSTPGIVVPPRDSIPQQGEGQWKRLRVHAEGRSRPNDLTIDAKAELVTQNGWMFGAQFVTQSGSFSGENLKEVWKGTYTDSRLEFWGGRHGASQDGRTRWSVVGFGRQLTHADSGSGQSRPGNPDSYTYKWSNRPKPITQVGGRARVEQDLIQSKYQQFTVFIEGEAATTVSGQSGWAYNVKTGLWSRTRRVEVYAEVCVNNTGACSNGYARYYLTKEGKLRPFVEARGEIGSGYHNVQVGGGVQIGIGKVGYAELSGGRNWGSAGDGPTFKIGGGFRF